MACVFFQRPFIHKEAYRPPFPCNTNGSELCILLCIVALLTVHSTLVWHLSIDRCLFFYSEILGGWVTWDILFALNPWLLITAFILPCPLLEPCLGCVCLSEITSVTWYLQISLLSINTFILASFLPDLYPQTKINF